MYDHAYKLDSLWMTAIYFYSFVVMSNIIIISLLKGSLTKYVLEFFIITKRVSNSDR
jgi:hypothetical protein